MGTTGPTGVAPMEPGRGRDPPRPSPVPDPRPRAEERDAWAVLAGVRGLGPVGFGALLARYGTAIAILREAASVGGTARLADVLTTRRRPIPRRSGLRRRGGRDRGRDRSQPRPPWSGSASWPHDRDPRRSDVPEPARLDRHAATCALRAGRSRGARHAGRRGRRRDAAGDGSRQGRCIAPGANLAAVGACVVSGLAVGIDGAAHAAALHAGGTTVAVIGSGHATVTPRAHETLAGRIVGSGGAIVSELGPDVVPTKGTFPRRNRIISGLSDATVVVEAPARSGALITASWALEQGRDCYLVPGAIDAPASAGCLAFLREFRHATRIVAGIPSSSTTSAWPTTWPKRASTRRPRRRLRMSARPRAGSGVSSCSDGTPSTSLSRSPAGRCERAGRPDPARATRSRGRRPRPVPARRTLAGMDPRSHDSARDGAKDRSRTRRDRTPMARRHSVTASRFARTSGPVLPFHEVVHPRNEPKTPPSVGPQTTSRSVYCVRPPLRCWPSPFPVRPASAQSCDARP